MKPKIVWTIAGFDPSSGAGITADLMTFAAHGLFGCSAITALTVQSTLGVAAVEEIKPRILARTLNQLADDLPPVGMKIGMLGSREAALVVGDFLRRRCRSKDRRHGSPPAIPVVFDPVLRSSSGRELYPANCVGSLGEDLLSCVDWLTPNWNELALLTGLPVTTCDEAERAARLLTQAIPRLNVVTTGGDQAVPTDVLSLHTGEHLRISGEHISTDATHGTGCAFSSALLANLVQGSDPELAVRAAKAYVAGALRHAPGLGNGKGPMNLLWPLTSRESPGSNA